MTETMKTDLVETSAFDELAGMIEAARARAWAAVNAELVGLYWEIGKWLSARCKLATWGDKIVDAASEYLRTKHPDLGSYTRRTLYRAREFYEAYAADEIVTPLVTQISWTNHLVILQRAKTPEERRFSPTMVATYQFALPDKNLLANRLRQITDFVLESAGVTELPEAEEESK